MASPFIHISKQSTSTFSQSLKAMQGKGIFPKRMISLKYFLQKKFSFASHGKGKEINPSGRKKIAPKNQP
jgi:hypothetical protein